MKNELYELLTNMQPTELLEFYNEFILQVSGSPRSYGGEKNLGKALGVLNETEGSSFAEKFGGKLEDSKLGRIKKIIGSKSHKEAITGTKKNRDDIAVLYKQYAKDIASDDELEIHNQVIAKAKSYLIWALIEMSSAWNYSYNSDSKKLEYADEKSNSKKVGFACYYWYDNIKTTRKVDVGLLELTFNGNDEEFYQITTAVMTLFPDRESEKHLTVLNSEKVIDNIDGVLIIQLKDHRLPIYSQLVLHVGRMHPEQLSIIIGTYSTVGRRNKDLPLAGVMLLEKKSKEELLSFPKERLNKDYVQPEILSFLFRSRLKGTTKMIQEVKDLPTFTEIKFIKKYVGRYQGIYYRKGKHQAILPGDSVERFILEIFNTGDAIMILPGLHGSEQSRYEGRIRVAQIKNDALIGFFDLLSANNVYRYTIYINKEFKGENKDELYAVYAGIERHDPFVPVAGRMKFKRIEEMNAERVNQNQDYINYIYRESLEDFLADPDTADLVDLFRGNGKEDYVETISSFEFGRNQSLEKALSRFAAAYNVYFLSTKQNKIYRIPLKLYSNGKVEMKARKPDSPSLQQGFANYNGSNRLSFYVQKDTKDNSFFHLLFHTGNHSYEASHFFGISSKFDEAGKPTARLEVLLKSNEDFDSASTKIFDIFSDEYLIENGLTNGLLSYLTGSDNRVITTKRTPDSEFQRNTQMKQVFFHASCHFFVKASHEESLQSLYQAYLHGFAQNNNEKELLMKELELSFEGANNLQIAAAPIDSKLPPLTFQQLFEKMLA